MKWFKANFTIPKDIYANTLAYKNGELFHLKTYEQSTIIDKYNIKIEISEAIHSDFSYESLKINFYIYNDKGILVNKDFRYITSIDSLMMIICIPSKNNKIKFLINVDIESSTSNKLKILKYKVKDAQYIRDSVLLANLKNKEDAIKICYLLIANDIERGELFESFGTIVDKFSYYGYIKKNYMATIDIYYNAKTAQEIIDNSIQKILYDIDKFTFKDSSELVDAKMAEKFASIIHAKYFNLLSKEVFLS